MENTIYSVYSRNEHVTRLILVEEVSGEGVVRMKMMGFGQSIDAYKMAGWFRVYTDESFDVVVVSATEFKKMFRGIRSVKDIFGK